MMPFVVRHCRSACVFAGAMSAILVRPIELFGRHVIPAGKA
jgi:hypothetical protein